MLPISNKFKQNLMQNVDSAHFKQNPNISDIAGISDDSEMKNPEVGKS